MENLTVKTTGHDFSALRAAMQRYVDQQILAGVSHAVLQGRDLVDVRCVGWADKERDVALRTDHIFRAFSNTKLITSCAVLLLFEDGRFELDDPVERYLPQLANRRVLKPGATTLDDTEPAKSPITIRHLMSHSSGLGHGIFEPMTVLSEAYVERKVRNPATPLSDMINVLADLPLIFHPGTRWEYSVATDVLGRLIEVLSGQRLDAFFQSRILDRLGMVDTAFVLPEHKHSRLTAYYKGADALDAMKPGLTRTDDAPYPDAYLKPFPRLSGGGGLVTTLPDMVALVRSLLPGGDTLLRPETISMMTDNQLPHGANIRWSGVGEVRGKGFGLAGAVTLKPSSIDPPGSEGTLEWGGIAGTHWWISRKANLAGLVMMQRQMAFWHPSSFEFKRLAFQAAGGNGAGA